MPFLGLISYWLESSLFLLFYVWLRKGSRKQKRRGYVWRTFWAGIHCLIWQASSSSSSNNNYSNNKRRSRTHSVWKEGNFVVVKISNKIVWSFPLLLSNSSCRIITEAIKSACNTKKSTAHLIVNISLIFMLHSNSVIVSVLLSPAISTAPRIHTNILFLAGGMMMSCLRTALKEWMKHVKKSASLMTHCALNSTRNSWRNMLNKMSCYGIVFQQFVKVFF